MWQTASLERAAKVVKNSSLPPALALCLLDACAPAVSLSKSLSRHRCWVARGVHLKRQHPDLHSMQPMPPSVLLWLVLLWLTLLWLALVLLLMLLLMLMLLLLLLWLALLLHPHEEARCLTLSPLRLPLALLRRAPAPCGPRRRVSLAQQRGPSLRSRGLCAAAISPPIRGGSHGPIQTVSTSGWRTPLRLAASCQVGRELRRLELQRLLSFPASLRGSVPESVCAVQSLAWTVCASSSSSDRWRCRRCRHRPQHLAEVRRTLQWRPTNLHPFCQSWRALLLFL